MQIEKMIFRKSMKFYLTPCWKVPTKQMLISVSTSTSSGIISVLQSDMFSTKVKLSPYIDISHFWLMLYLFVCISNTRIIEINSVSNIVVTCSLLTNQIQDSVQPIYGIWNNDQWVSMLVKNGKWQNLMWIEDQSIKETTVRRHF